MEYTWDDIEQYVAACTQCPLGRTRHLPVMGCGNHSADIQKLVDESATRKLDQHDYCKKYDGYTSRYAALLFQRKILTI